MSQLGPNESNNTKNDTQSEGTGYDVVDLGERIIRAREDERYRLAREIHDGPAQSLANIVLRAEVCERLLEAGRPEAKQEVSQLKLLVREALREVRRIIYDLRPGALAELGLVPTLQGYFEYMREHNGTEVELQVEGNFDVRLPSTLEVGLFRTVQEAVTNAWRHAQADRIAVHFRFEPERVNVTVSDDGIGFDVQTVLAELHRRSSFGLTGMRERVELLGGELRIESAPERGTTVYISVPVCGECS